MKFNKFVHLFAVTLALSFTAVGCKKNLQKVTPLPGHGGVVGDERPTRIGDGNRTDIGTTPFNNNPPIVTPVVPTPPSNTGEGIENPGNVSGWVPDAQQPFSGETVLFEFDKATVRSTEMPKIENVARGMKNFPGKGLRIAGHCDERGTEEYNRSLGERRALAVREHLVRLGVDYKMIDTISYGEDKPLDPGHDAAAWSKNRRGEFILLTPPGAK